MEPRGRPRRPTKIFHPVAQPPQYRRPFLVEVADIDRLPGQRIYPANVDGCERSLRPGICGRNKDGFAQTQVPPRGARRHDAMSLGSGRVNPGQTSAKLLLTGRRERSARLHPLDQQARVGPVVNNRKRVRHTEPTGLRKPPQPGRFETELVRTRPGPGLEESGAAVGQIKPEGEADVSACTRTDAFHPGIQGYSRRVSERGVRAAAAQSSSPLRSDFVNTRPPSMLHHYSMAFKAIRLDSGGGLSATFVPGAGMIVVSLTFEGEEFLDQREGLGKYVESGSTLGVPILYPWANRLARDSWKFGPQPARIKPGAYRVKRDENGLAIHGTLAASSLWEVAEARAEDDLGSASVKAILDFGAHPELLRTFPFPHRIELEFRLTGSRLTVRTTVTATGDLAVPLAYGFHPYLTLPGSERAEWTVALPAMLGLETDTRHIPTGESEQSGAFEGPLEDRDYDDAFSGVTDGAAFSVSDSRRQITVCFERGFHAAQVYSPVNENFICFEPMKAPSNALVSGRDLTSVEPGQSDIAEFSISVGEPGSLPAATVAAKPGRPEPSRYRLERENSVESVRRVARGRVDSAVSSLRQGAKEDRATAVHTARKDMKKMRSVLRLVRDELGKNTYREENRRYRDAARLLSATRDSEVLAGTLDSVLEDYPEGGPSVDGLVSDLVQRRRLASSEGETSSNAALDEAADRIEAGGRRIAVWPLESTGWRLFEPGLKRCYAAGRKDLTSVEEQLRRDQPPEPEVMHDWRKRVKDLWYATRLLREAWPAGLEGPEDESSRLADLLGDYNDLSVLLDEIETRHTPADDGGSWDEEDFSVLAETIESRQRGLLDDCLPIARRLYAEDPAAFTARIGAYWSA